MQRTLGKYVMLETLGAGGFSKVRLGYDEVTKEKVALKILKKDKLNLNSSTKKQVEREITAMAKIHHQNVIQLKSVDWDAVYQKKNGQKLDVILVVLELATGGELFEFLAFTGCFEEAIARTYFHQLIEGLSYCHAQGVAHRDLKPENLLLDKNFVLKLADFGFSNVFTTNDKLMYTECGTPGYMAPEMFKGKGYDPTGADVWACGVILFIMLAGFPPFQKPMTTDWWFQKLATNKHHLFWEAHSRTAYFSDSVKDFINKVLQPDHTKRISIADIKKHPWYQGPTISPTALNAEFQRRKDAVDEGKARERIEKKKAKGGGDLMEDDLDRDLEVAERADSDDLPGQTPFGVVVSSDKLSTTATASATSSLAAANGAVNLMVAPSTASSPLSAHQQATLSLQDFASPSEKEFKQAQPQLYQPTVLVNTHFESNKSANQLLQRLSGSLDQLGAQYSVNQAQYKIKATIVTFSGTIQMNIQIFQHPTKPNTQVIEFRRRQGESLQFRSLYSDLRNQLSDVVLSSSHGKEAEHKASASSSLINNNAILSQ